MSSPSRIRLRLGLATLMVLGAASIAPAGAAAIEIQTQQVRPDVLFITATQGFSNDVGVSWVTSPSGAPDLVVGDTTAGIPDPIPSICARVDPMIVRCPANVFMSLDVDLGPGPDSIGVTPAAGIDGFISMRLSLGPGRDRASDQGMTRDVMKGGPGRDQLASGPLNDLVKGGPQNDIIDCGAGSHDVGIGGPGRFDLGRNCEVVRH